MARPISGEFSSLDYKHREVMYQSMLFGHVDGHISDRQRQVIRRFTETALRIAEEEDVPPAVPLTLWFKENSLSRTSPDNCEGLMGMHSYYKHSERCFPSLYADVPTVESQLRMGTKTFKSYCPDIRFGTTEDSVIQECYLYYNSGPGTETKVDESAYVVNGYNGNDGMWMNTAYGDRIWITSLGAYPAHVLITGIMAEQSMIKEVVQ